MPGGELYTMRGVVAAERFSCEVQQSTGDLLYRSSDCPTAPQVALMLLLSLPTLHHVNDDDVHGASGKKALVLAQLDACGGGETDRVGLDSFSGGGDGASV